MTIGIAVCLQDGALLIADGRVTPITSNGEVVNDANKIRRISESVASISFGITIVTDTALSLIRRDIIDQAESPEDVLAEVEKSVKYGWDFLQARLAPDVDRKHRKMRAGLLVGGYLLRREQSSFIGGVLFRPNRHNPPTIRTDPLSFIVLGGEENNSQGIFKQVAKQEINKIVSPVGVWNAYVDAFLHAGATTIRQIEKINPDVGGVIRYTILRRGFPYSEDILSR